MRVLILVALVIFALDQALKYYVVQILNLKEVFNIDVLPPVLNLRMAWNDGINFGLFGGDHPAKRWVLIGVALLISAVVLYWVRRENGGFWQNFAAGLLIGGAIGNVVDRLVYGAVADFINNSCCGFHNPFSYNVADIAVFAGALGMVFFSSDQKPA